MPWRKRAMMIDLGESQVLKRHVAQPRHRAVDVHFSAAHLLEKRPELILVHQGKNIRRQPLPVAARFSDACVRRGSHNGAATGGSGPFAPRQREGHHHRAGGDRHVLLAFEGYVTGGMIRASLEPPQQLAGLCIECQEVAVVIADEHETSGSGHGAARGMTDHFITPTDLAGLGSIATIDPLGGSPGTFEKTPNWYCAPSTYSRSLRVKMWQPSAREVIETDLRAERRASQLWPPPEAGTDLDAGFSRIETGLPRRWATRSSSSVASLSPNRNLPFVRSASRWPLRWPRSGLHLAAADRQGPSARDQPPHPDRPCNAG